MIPFHRPNKISRTSITLIGFFLLVNLGCVETFEPNTLTFENILVIEAIITDELKQQQIVLSRTTPLEESGVAPEGQARILIEDEDQRQYAFSETDPGIYLSNEAFKAELGSMYRLSVQTKDGKSYMSEPASVQGLAQIDDLRAVRVINENGTDGVEISIDGSGISGETSFFRYEYEETYQIISPFAAVIEDLVVVSESPPQLDLVRSTEEERVCYNTLKSKGIILSTSSQLGENKIKNLPVRFISNDNQIIRGRYSILVKQFVQSREAHSFYGTLSEISDLDNLFSQIQPGFVEGNISAVGDPDENVIGIFEVSSVSTKRIFFSFKELFPDIDTPPFFVGCQFFEFGLPIVGDDFRTLSLLLDQGYELATIKEDFFGNISAYVVVTPACGDCTPLGSNVEPDFWEE